MEHDPRVIEEHAYSLLSQEKYDEAFRSFIKAAHIFKNQKNHKLDAPNFTSLPFLPSVTEILRP